MRWEDERYVRLYTRDTTTWKLLPWQSKALLPLILRKVDRAGIIDLGDDGTDGLAAILDMPAEFVEAGLPPLVRRGVVALSDVRLVMPNFMVAQECRQTDAQRKRDSRERQRAEALNEPPPSQSPAVTKTDDESHGVTDGHQPSPPVTDGHQQSLLAVPSLASSPSLSDSQIERDPSESTGTGAKAEVQAPPASPLRHRADAPGMSARSDDGCFGSAVQAFEDGVKAATGKPFTRLGAFKVADLLAVLDAHFPDLSTRIGDVRSAAEAFARAESNHKPVKFGEWLDRGRKTAREVAFAPPETAPAPYHSDAGPKARAAQAKRDREFAEAAREATPMPTELRALVGSLGALPTPKAPSAQPTIAKPVATPPRVTAAPLSDADRERRRQEQLAAAATFDERKQEQA